MSTSAISSSGHLIQTMLTCNLAPAVPPDTSRQLRIIFLQNSSQFLHMWVNTELSIQAHLGGQSCCPGAQGGGCWASTAFQSRHLLGSASPIKGGNGTVRCQQLHPLQNKKPLSGTNALSNYSPLERKSAFSQGDSRTLRLHMLSFPFHG